MGRDAGNLDFSAASNYWRCHISDYFPAETLYWFKKTLQDGSSLIIWHAWYDPRCFSFLDAQTQEALRIAGLENAPIRRQAEYWAGRSIRGADIERRLKPVGLQSVINWVATPVEQCWLHSLTDSRQQLCARGQFGYRKLL
ncbi:hypothetical protein A7T52_19440 [Salmonella enterica subsp. diarizonae serovar 60:r:e,n,x,z15]|uniref:hypothetical protein n=1 Tax=Salmonella enterica TaxID=28901 RepID=UPI0008A6291A|nr:hypothetical protein [Salmonella enterica]OHG19190.1 hypothetical protein A7T52_19440 [Salmonella enterica subsp. diarizonae serovar 60:r:e,n,x,z15]OHM89095.1 hypothetical protein A7T45_19445 [Salmonella enterica]